MSWKQWLQEELSGGMIVWLGLVFIIALLVACFGLYSIVAVIVTGQTQS